jgi:iron complex outermembrane receptor protein
MLTMSAAMLAQAAGSGLKGTTADTFGGMIGRATVTAKNDATGKTYNAVADALGRFSLADLPAGSYTVQATAPGFAVATQKVVVGSDQLATAALTLTVSGTSDSVTVEANSTGSVAAALAPMDALLGETSARTEISAAFINNFTSPISDYGEIVQMVPSTFTLSSDGIGLGQSKTYFRGFPDGDYDIDFDGIPFYDTNSPTHHSWAFFPSMYIGGVDFDRSPGSASTIGPTPFGGSIHLLSKDLSPLQNVRATFSGGSFNTYLYDAQYDSGKFGPGGKFNTTIDVHHMQSHGWQSLNNQQQDGGDIKFEYRLSPKTILTGYAGVIQVNANTPNFSATRCQMYGPSNVNATTHCTVSATSNVLLPYTGAGINFLLTNNSDPLLYLNTEYNKYHIPTDFEYVGVHKEFAHNIVLDIKPYTYNYDNGEIFANATTITENLASTFNEPGYPKGTHLGLPVAPCNVQVKGKLPCAVDKYNSYRKYGETSTLSQVSRFGVLRAGMWYEWARTNRHQYPTDPLMGYRDQPLPNFAEKFVTNSYQPFAEFEFHATKKLALTPGVKFAYYTVGTQQFADNGKTIGGLGSNNPAAFISNGGSYFATLPSVTANYRINNGWSVYGQFAEGSIVPPSNVFDYTQNTDGTTKPVATLPKQQKNITYQTGTVLKLKNVTFDADYFHVHFDNGYNPITTQASGGEPVFFATPPSVTQGLEGEANIYMTHGLSLYLNASYNRAVYSGGSLTSTCLLTTAAATAACAAQTAPVVNTPNGLDVQQTPSDIETEAILYQKGSWDAAFFNKRIGTYYIDSPNGYHDANTVNPFSLDNLYVNYTIHSGGRFNNTKFRIDFTNIFNDNSINGITLANSSTAVPVTPGSLFGNPFLATGQTPIAGGDNVGVNAGRSIMLTVTFGTSMKR